MSNTGEDVISDPGEKYNAEHGSGALTVFEPRLEEARREELYAGWKRAVDRARDWER